MEPPPRLRVVTRQGSPTELGNMDRVSVGTAQRVIMVPPAEADGEGEGAAAAGGGEGGDEEEASQQMRQATGSGHTRCTPTPCAFHAAHC